MYIHEIYLVSLVLSVLEIHTSRDVKFHVFHSYTRIIELTKGFLKGKFTRTLL